jgi:hypothetical protein
MTTLEIDAVSRIAAEPAAAPTKKTDAPSEREVRHEYTHSLAELLSQLGISLLVSTYQAGKVVAVGVADNDLTLSYHNFERAMGLAIKPDCIAVGARAQVWFLRSAADLARRVEPAGRHDVCFLTRSSHFTGEVQAHELAWASTDSLSPRALVSTHDSECVQAVEKSNSFPLDGGRLGWGWEGQSTLAPPPRPSPTTWGGRILNCPQNPRCVDANAPGGRGQGDGELWLVNTAFSCLCTLDDRHSFVPRWRPPFITALAAEDRCHLNGMAMAPNEQDVPTPRYVTALAETNTPQGWRPNKVSSGCLIDVVSGETVARGFAMPHSPRVHAGRVWLLHSGAGQLVLVDPARGHVQTVTELPGYTRGLAMYDRYAFVGLSKIRETSTFGGMPIAERRPELKCGVGVVDLTTGLLVAHLEFVTGVEEIFDVQVVKGARCPALSGPYPSLDSGKPIWTVPQAAQGSKEE